MKTKGRPTKQFNGKTFAWHTSTYTESDATKEAWWLKSQGYLTKVIEEPIFGRQMWAIYKRESKLD